MQEAIEHEGFEVSIAPYALGDASFHVGWTFHRADPNRTEVPRRAMTVIYFDADMTVAEPANENQAGDLRAWMPGARPGDVLDTPMNPVLYRVGS